MVTVVVFIIYIATVGAALVSPPLSGTSTASIITTLVAHVSYWGTRGVVEVGIGKVTSGSGGTTAAATLVVWMVESATVKWRIHPHPVRNRIRICSPRHSALAAVDYSSVLTIEQVSTEAK